MEDLSDDLARIQIAFETLGLEWESARVQAWVEKAGRAYLLGYVNRGEKCPMPPPYPHLQWLPDELVRALANVLWKEVKGGKFGDGATNEPGRSG